VKTILKESCRFELARLKKKKKKVKYFGCLATFWFSTIAIHFSTTGCVAHHESTRRDELSKSVLTCVVSECPFPFLPTAEECIAHHLGCECYACHVQYKVGKADRIANC